MGPEKLHPSIQGLIDTLKGGESLRERVTGQALEDIYASGKFRTAILRGVTGGNMNTPQEILCVRLVTVTGHGGYESSVMTQPSFIHRSREFIEKLRRDLANLPVGSGLVTPMLPMLEEVIALQGLTVIAAQQLSTDIATQKEMGAVLYPRVFRDLPLPLITDSQRDSLGLAMATGVLKLVPFGRHPVRFTLPAR